MRKLRLVLCAFMITLTMLPLAGCIATESTRVPASIKGDEITISTGTQGAVGKLFIGLGDTGKQDYVDNNGKTRTRLMAWLYLHIDGDSPANTQQQVHVGQTVNFQDYVLYVREISAGGIARAPGASTGHVSLIVQQPSTALPLSTKSDVRYRKPCQTLLTLTVQS